MSKSSQHIYSGKERLLSLSIVRLSINFLALSQKCQVKRAGKESGKLLSGHSDSVVQSHSELDQKTVIPVFVYCIKHKVDGTSLHLDAFRL